MKILLSNFNVRSTHPIHRSLYTHGPEGYEYSQYLAPRHKCWTRTFRNAILGKPEYDVIPDTDDAAVFSIGLLPKTKKRWMAFLENYHVFSNNLYYPPIRREKLREEVREMLRKGNCYRIVAYTDIAAQQIRDWLDDKQIDEKIDTLHPVIPDKKIGKIEHDKQTILFVANTDFYGKGGKEVLVVAEEILKKYDAEFIIKSPVPQKYLDKYQGKRGFTFITRFISDEELMNLYARSDIYLFPLYTASFGVFLEAKIAELPIVTCSHFDMTDIVEDGVTGFTVDNPHNFFQPDFEQRWTTRKDFNEEIAELRQPKMEKELVKAVAKLIENPDLARKLGKAGKREVVSGKFSIKERNKKLKKLYEGLK